MKRRYKRYLLNLLCLVVLMFSLYLNFVKKDSPESLTVPVMGQATSPASTTANNNAGTGATTARFK